MKQISDTSRTSLLLLLITIGCFLVMSILATGFSLAIVSVADIPLGNKLIPELDQSQRQGLRFILLLNNLLCFAGTAALALFIVYRKDWQMAGGLQKARLPSLRLPAIALFLASLPVVVYLSWLNLQIPLPDWAMADEAKNNALLAGVLRMETPLEFFIALVTAAVTPAIGEELLMRGVLQQRIFYGLFRNHHVAIWLAAIIFSAGHFEFAGFLPRLVLGAALGYSYYWTKSLWVPIILHLIFNGLQVVQAYVSGEFNPDTQIDFTPPWYLGAVGIIITGAIFYYGENKLRNQEKATAETEREQLEPKASFWF